MKYTQEELHKTHQELLSASQPKAAIVGALVAAVPAFFMYQVFVEMGHILLLMILTPALLIGFAAQFMGRVYRMKDRIPIAVIAVALHLTAVYLMGYYPRYYAVTPFVFMVAVLVAKRPTNRIQNLVIELEKEGRMSDDEK